MHYVAARVNLVDHEIAIPAAYPTRSALVVDKVKRQSKSTSTQQAARARILASARSNCTMNNNVHATYRCFSMPVKPGSSFAHARMPTLSSLELMQSAGTEQVFVTMFDDYSQRIAAGLIRSSVQS